MDFKNFVKAIVPNIEDRWEIAQMTPEQLIGKKVISIRSGFSNSGGGQIMLVDEADTKRVHFVPTEESTDRHEGHLGWSCEFQNISHSVILYKEK